MKLRSLLILSNLLSLSVILIFLIISYVQMSIPPRTSLSLIGITLLAGAVSFLIHLGITSPLLKAVKQMISDSKMIGEGQFEARTSLSGPKEIRELALQFNDMAERLNTLFQQLKQSERYKTELIANISHDLRTPVASILSFAEALEDGVVQDERDRIEYLGVIKRETLRLSKLIEELFELSALDKESMPFEPSASYADDLLIKSLQQFELKLKENGLKVEVGIEENLPAVYAVPEAIIRVLTNLIQNAITYSPRNSSLGLTVEKRESGLLFSVSDEGPGIAIEEQGRIFDRFYRLEKSRNKEHGGTGLGLAICREMVERHGGEIGVISAPGEGSEFWFTIPFNRKEESI
ncbi:HAMP domain-containing histidine kinase [Metabacillus sp. GX 13764]|uniref:sensor histidine kinase n=1 Tax=Metabacillus kandeliae TaxID=2900151 RepID=UPI001E587B03|nr:HAMP domain-containing sensor histidine kinase [Metabacillus kandeliae]MCD7032649.1 HAMP domain-containing histidine kinase [Metabacillus kandeliae]